MKLTINNKKTEDRDTNVMVSREYNHLLDVFEKGEKMTLPLHRPRVVLGIELENRKQVPIKNIYALSYNQIEKLHRYLKQNQEKG